MLAFIPDSPYLKKYKTEKHSEIIDSMVKILYYSESKYHIPEECLHRLFNKNFSAEIRYKGKEHLMKALKYLIDKNGLENIVYYDNTSAKGDFKYKLITIPFNELSKAKVLEESITFENGHCFSIVYLQDEKKWYITTPEFRRTSDDKYYFNVRPRNRDNSIIGYLQREEFKRDFFLGTPKEIYSFNITSLETKVISMSSS